MERCRAARSGRPARFHIEVVDDFQRGAASNVPGSGQAAVIFLIMRLDGTVAELVAIDASQMRIGAGECRHRRWFSRVR